MTDKVKDAELLKSALAMGSVKLVEHPELITVRTISPKVVEQLPWFDTSAEYATPTSSNRSDYSKYEIIGVSEKTNAIIVRDEAEVTVEAQKAARLGKIRVLNFLMWLRGDQHMDLEASQGVVRALPQLFEV